VEVTCDVQPSRRRRSLQASEVELEATVTDRRTVEPTAGTAFKDADFIPNVMCSAETELSDYVAVPTGSEVAAGAVVGSVSKMPFSPPPSSFAPSTSGGGNGGGGGGGAVAASLEELVARCACSCTGYMRKLDS